MFRKFQAIPEGSITQPLQAPACILPSRLPPARRWFRACLRVPVAATPSVLHRKRPLNPIHPTPFILPMLSSRIAGPPLSHIPPVSPQKPSNQTPPVRLRRYLQKCPCRVPTAKNRPRLRPERIANYTRFASAAT